MTIIRQTEFWTRESVSNDPDRYYLVSAEVYDESAYFMPVVSA